MRLNSKQLAAVEQEVERRLSSLPVSLIHLSSEGARLRQENEKLRRKLLHRALVGHSIATEEETLAIIRECQDYLDHWNLQHARVQSIVFHGLSFVNNVKVRTCRVHFKFKSSRPGFYLDLEGDGLEWTQIKQGVH